MKTFYLTFFFVVILSPFVKGQTIFQEDFESGFLPDGWIQQSLATDGGWQIGDAATLSSQYWPIANNGSDNIAATNDDACNCNKREDYLITPPLDFTGLSRIALSFDILFGKGSYQTATERATVEISLDGITWTEVSDLPGHAATWATRTINLSNYAGQDSVYLAFHYDDEGGWLYGLAIDNVSVSVPPSLDAELVKLKSLPNGEENTNISIRGTILNNSSNPIDSLELEYSIDGGSPVSFILDSIDIQPFQEFEFVHPTVWTPTQAGDYHVVVNIKKVNGTEDENINNNTLNYYTTIYPHIVAPNIVDDFLLAPPVFTTVATAAEGLDKPTDLDFFPILAKNELWVVNQRIESSGGSTLTLYDAGAPDESFLPRVDGNAWHFMSLATGIAFSDNFNFATSPGIQDANHSGGTFTGPSLWTSDPTIYAQPSGGNGSHIDMIHQSPYSMGIASETDNVFWVFDGWNTSIVRYDFQNDHGPGNDDHSDGIVRRYSEVKVKRDTNIPSHLVLDKNSGWLYIVDNGNHRVLRMDIHSGDVVGSLPHVNEPLAEYSQMGNVKWEVIIDSLNRPSGIELIGNRLLVGDYGTGDISIYDIDNNFLKLGSIATGNPGLTGLKIGPDGALWFTNRTLNTLTKMDPGEVTGIQEDFLASHCRVSPNPTSGELFVEILKDISLEGAQLTLTNLEGKSVIRFAQVKDSQYLDLDSFANGIYFLTISSQAINVTKKIILQK